MRRRALVRIGGALLAVAALAGCRVDTEIEVTVKADGTGDVVVSITADAEVVDEAPGLADDFRADDLVASGWVVEGPTTSPDGGLAVVLRHPFASIAEANAVLAQLSAGDGPLRELAVGVGGTSGDIEWTFDGQLDMSRGLDAFADQDLVALNGATPWLDAITAKGLTPAEVATLTFRASLPGTRVLESDVTAAPGAAEYSAAAGDAPVVMSVRALASSAEVEDARDLKDRMVNLLLGYAAVVLAGVAIWRLVRGARRRSRSRLAR